MGIFDKLRGALGGSGGSRVQDARNYWFYVRCSACGETIKGRVDLYNELSQREEGAGFLVRKTLIGSERCYRPIEVTLYFDENRRLTDQKIRGGEFVSADDIQPA